MNTLLQAQLDHLVDGFPGAATVLGELLAGPRARREQVFADLEALGVKGAYLWKGYSDWADQDMLVFAMGLKERDPVLMAVMGVTHV
jgi:hypothetical protein